MALDDRRVLLLAADLFEDMELLYPLYRLREEGAEVVVAGLDEGPLHGKRGYSPLTPDTSVDRVAMSDFDALVIPGGFAPDHLRRSDDVLQHVRDTVDTDKPLAFICHAGWVPASAGVLKGRRVTSTRAIRDDVINAGAEWVDEPTVVDGQMISARTPPDLGHWLKAIIAALQ